MIRQIRRTLSSLCNQNRRPHLHKPFSIYESILFFSTSEPEKSAAPTFVSDYLTDRHNLSPTTALKVSSYRSRLKDPEKADAIINFLKDVGFTTTHFELALYRAPCLLFSIVDNIRPKIKILQDAGFSPSDIVEITSSDPWILTRSADNRLFPSVVALKNVLGSVADASKLLKLCGWFLRSDLEKTLLPNVEMMKSCGVPSQQITRYLLVFPRMFLNKPEKLKGFIAQVDEMGVERGSLVFLLAIRAIGSMSPESWELKLGVFRSLGFSDEDILSIFRKVPLTFTISEKKIREVSRILFETGEANTALLVSRPELLMLSTERRLKPRLRVVKILESKNLLKKKPTLTTTCKISEEVFLKKYVFPYSDILGDAYGTVSSSVSAE
ncbi:hypothetical protein CDL15_Pgr006244 [Punica granatum]|uniref:Uncharacterized protein n=1 Tax=Punica granatum TaxID=22663 RepID=A0A218X5J3_PUNGR|nr:hypothetical protein CDL15_Pgr006244 [Punica granatum]PKI73893.1 hypothetical protein CRG98_005763 [Punica granatum]